ncbi:SCP2 sterol-binding domain-containing protein [Paenactinomyces guangxiensis]|uniref:SCP2 sterol-binding domain-containing protein n=1 Tax=Paenactinomyces guangxiensis TaxID=1490290 RepID=A0A7W1WR90_9BACL|nr:SCP2 sterol-binding domain-containing protein [Paenactinomyces guangxiensis]MBA4494607.1 SCP2 sterol-binding domain-containing protein [Paenactinomyces guangxiensis]MBH8591630.1 SCP2 sterol-binding domain-containing protein [Paenactinomyces guangxiensis]
MSANFVLTALVEKINENPEGISEVEAVYQLDLSGGTYQVRFSRGKAECAEGTPWESQCTLQISDDNFSKLVEGKLSPTAAFMSGKLKVKGELGQALKLQSILQKYE